MAIPEPTRSSLTWKLTAHQRQHWPQLKELKVRFRGDLAYVDGLLPDGGLQPLCRLRYGGSATFWGYPYCARSLASDTTVSPTYSTLGTAARGIGEKSWVTSST